MSRQNFPDRTDAVYFFGTCLIDIFYPEAGLAGIALIEREGVEVIYPEDQSCCGQPAFNSGYASEARRVAARQIETFPDDIPVVVPSSSCAVMMRFHYPELFAGTPLQARAEGLASRVFELTEFLVEVLQIKLIDHGEPIRVANHVSCSALRKLEVGPASGKLLDQLEGVTLVQQSRAEECCGFGGTFAVKHAEVSAAMVVDKADALEQADAQLVVGGDCGCLMNIDGHLRKRGSSLTCKHIAQLLWERSRDE
jgi:L-lactate dehydrogenase complex protein LldE